MKVFLQYDDVPIKHESFLSAKSVSCVPEEEKWLYTCSHDKEDEEAYYQVYKVIILDKDKSYVRHNVLSMEVI